MLGGFQIDNQLELRRLFHREVGGLSALKNLVDVGGGLPVQISLVRPVGHEPTRVHELAGSEHCRQTVIRRKFRDSLPIGI